jgi:hypothetical protein
MLTGGSSHTISLEQLLPILMSTPESKQPPRLPFKFQGGFEFSTQTVGSILAVQGVLQMIAQLVLFPWINRKIGSLRTFWLTMGTYPLLYLIAPYLALLPERLRIPGIFLLLVWKVTAQSLSYPSLNMMLVRASPSTKVLGTLNGAAASSASLCRGLGPTVSGAIATAGEHNGISGLAWWVCAGIALVAWIPGSLMEEKETKEGTKEDEETGFAEALVPHDSDTDSVSTILPYGTVEVMPPSLPK